MSILSLFHKVGAAYKNDRSKKLTAQVLLIGGIAKRKQSKYRKYIIGSIYRRPSQLVADLTQFIDEFSETLAKIHATCKQAYIIGDYNIDLLQLHRNIYYNTFYENVTAQGFFPKLTRPTRSFGNTHTLIDNVFTNNIGKPHISGILTHHVSDHFMSFCVVEGKVKRTKDTPKYIEVENITPLSISNFLRFVKGF